MHWLTDYKIPLGRWAQDIFDWLQIHGGWFFDGLAGIMGWLIDQLLWILQTPGPIAIAVIVTAASFWLQRNWKVSVFVFLGFLFIVNQGYWEETTESLALVISSCIICMAIGVPIGIFAAHRPRLYQVLQPILDLMQTLPTFVYLIPVLILFGLGAAPGLIVTVIFAAPAPIRLTYLGITSVPLPLKEAGLAFGATKRQLLWKVELPAALPSIMAGLTQCIMLSLSMVVIAALIGANGLGKPVVRALNSVNIPLGIEAGLAIVVLAIILDRITRLGREQQK